jgi:hypothetical protein
MVQHGLAPFYFRYFLMQELTLMSHGVLSLVMMAVN